MNSTDVKEDTFKMHTNFKWKMLTYERLDTDHIQAILEGDPPTGGGVLLPIYRRALYYLGENRIRWELIEAQIAYREGTIVRRDNGLSRTLCRCFLARLKMTNRAKDIFKRSKKRLIKVDIDSVSSPPSNL